MAEGRDKFGRFLKGTSGHPGGRPVKEAEIRKQFFDLVKCGDVRLAYKVLFINVLNGQPWAHKEFWSRVAPAKAEIDIAAIRQESIFERLNANLNSPQ